MDRHVSMALVIALLVVLLGLMAFGWWRLRRRQSSLPAPPAPPETMGEEFARVRGTYLSTTAAGEPLQRIAVHGLGFRGDAEITVSEAGMVVGVPGERDLFIGAGALRGIRRATWTIDRTVEPDGLHVVEWTLGDTPVDSFFRIIQPLEFDAATARLTAQKGTS